MTIRLPEAAYTLKEFANQAEVEIMFNPQIVYGVRTNAVNGKYYPHLALRIMLSETSLTVNYDKETVTRCNGHTPGSNGALSPRSLHARN